MKIDPLSGIVIDTVEAADATKWGNGEGLSYAMKVTLKDVTAAAEATPIPAVDITVKEKAGTLSIESAVTTEANLIVGELTGTEEQKKAQHLVTESTTADQIADWLQAAVAKSTDPDVEYAVVLVDITGVVAPTTQNAGSLDYTYKVIHSLKTDYWGENVIVEETMESVPLPQKTEAPTP